MMAPSSGELYGHHLMPSRIEVDCLLPNGIIITLDNVFKHSTLEKIKDDLWIAARDYPLYQILKDKDNYKFVSITQDAEREEFYDEGRQICDLKLFQPVLKLIEPEGNKEEKMANSKISQALGVSVHDFDEVKNNKVEVHSFNNEVVEFRRNAFAFVKACFEERTQLGPDGLALYQYPPEIEDSPELPQGLHSNLTTKNAKETVMIAVWSISDEMRTKKNTMAVALSATPGRIIRDTIHKNVRGWNIPQEEKDRIIAGSEESYVLKVAGIDQYLLEQCQISQYKYIRSCIARNQTANLMMMNKKTLYELIPPGSLHIPSYYRKGFNPSNPRVFPLWSSEKTTFKIRVESANFVNVKEADQIFVRLGLFNGTEPLCQIAETRRVGSTHLRWDEWVSFEIHTVDLPRAAKLCLAVCAAPSGRRGGGSGSVRIKGNQASSSAGGATGTSQGSESSVATTVTTPSSSEGGGTMLCWCNLNLFDYNGYLVNRRCSLNFRLPPREWSDMLYPLGQTTGDWNDLLSQERSRDSCWMTIDFERGERSGAVTVFPTAKQFIEYAVFIEKIEKNPSTFNPLGCHVPSSNQVGLSEAEASLLEDILERDPLAEISEQERETLWRLRRQCMTVKYANILPRLLDAVKWNSRDDVATLYLLLEKWPKVSPVTALEMLDCKYGDPTIRRYAVGWLNDMSDEDLSQYLLQLVQTLKYEPYLANPLTELLLRRALLNRKIGHIFFWHLRCELLSQTHPVVRFGLVLEAFCRGLGPYLKDLIKQVEALDKLTALTFSLKERGPSNSNAKDLMRQNDYAGSLQFFQSPLENNVTFGELKIGECRVMDSAKKPLWLVWKNNDHLAKDINYETNAVIFKNGDDLRQDMLTLQVIKIMDHIWRDQEGMDLRMTPYSCLATGNQVGIIEVVRNSKTVFDIQRGASRLASMQIDSSQLYKWIRDRNNKSSDQLDQALQSFTLSCAGYCVATFILGIGDRHPGNIMVCDNGRIFHIDFGHFLGHFKKKFGINRERVPFVLTDDFLYVISRGKENPKETQEFTKFQELCGEAYLALRRHSNLLITLFTMMLPAGITELQSIDNIGYLRQTLAVEKSEKEALKYFQTVFYDAYEGAWTTKVDWFFHSAKRGFQ